MEQITPAGDPWGVDRLHRPRDPGRQEFSSTTWRDDLAACLIRKEDHMCAVAFLGSKPSRRAFRLRLECIADVWYDLPGRLTSRSRGNFPGHLRSRVSPPRMARLVTAPSSDPGALGIEIASWVDCLAAARRDLLQATQ